MATSTFTKQFSVDRKNAADFVKEMSRAATPTLKPNFSSNLAHPSQDSVLRNNLLAALNKK